MKRGLAHRTFAQVSSLSVLRLECLAPFAPRTNKDIIEEALFAQRRDLFSSLDMVFFDTTSIYFEGEGGATMGQRGHSKDHRPDLKQMVVGIVDTNRPKQARGKR